MAEGNGRFYMDAASVLGARRGYGEVAVPEWGEQATIRIRGLSAREAIEISECDQVERHGRVVSLGAVDEHGNRLFGDADVPKLMDLAVAPLLRIATAILDLSGDQGIEAAKKKSASAPSAASPLA